MNLIPLILDCDVPYVQGAAGPVSLLMLPLGTGRILDALISNLLPVAPGEILVLSSRLDHEDEGLQHLRRTRLPLRLANDETLQRELERFEASDYLLVVDPRLWPLGNHGFSDCPRLTESYCGATHVVAVGANGESARERVECDGQGYVRRVQRLYAAKNYSEVGGSTILHSVVPLRAAIGLRFNMPVELRVSLSATGVLSQDQPRRVDVARLGTEAGFLRLMEHSVRRTAASEPVAAGFRYHRPGVLVGQDCQIHPGVRLVGPLIVQHGGIIEQGATVVGPAVLGAGSRVMHNASVVHSALAAGTVVRPGVVVHGRVACGDCTAGTLAKRSAAAEPGPGLPLEIHPAEQAGAPNRVLGVARGRWLHFALKRSLDVILSAIALTVLAPLFVLVTVMIKLDSAGPAFFAHRREGRKGRDFPCWKFRTMVQDAHQLQRAMYKHSEVDGPQFKIRNDPRVTRVGRWLRITNVDELPQLINVLLGHMSLVGPRPSPFRENQICIPWRRARLSIRPGITGLWQVCRDENRQKGDFHEWIFYDMTYVRHFSFWLDLRILVATLLTAGGKWSVPLAWLLPGTSHGTDPQQFPVTAA